MKKTLENYFPLLPCLKKIYISELNDYKVYETLCKNTASKLFQKEMFSGEVTPKNLSIVFTGIIRIKNPFKPIVIGDIEEHNNMTKISVKYTFANIAVKVLYIFYILISIPMIILSTIAIIKDKTPINEMAIVIIAPACILLMLIPFLIEVNIINNKIIHILNAREISK